MFNIIKNFAVQKVPLLLPTMSIKPKPILVLDQDDVIVDTYGKMAQIIVRDFDTDFSLEDFYARAFNDLLTAEHKERIYQELHKPGFFADIPAKEGAVEAVKLLAAKYDVYVATAAMEFPNSFREKYDWLQTNLPFVPYQNLIFCGHKSILRADVIVDDMPRNFAGQGSARCLLFNAPHNYAETRYERVNNWAQILEKL